MGYDTAGQIISDAATLCGLTPPANPFTSTDPLFTQLVALLKSAGRDVVRDFEWPQLRVRYNFTTAASVAEYAMPEDFNRWVNETQWNTSSRLPLGGPIPPDGWELLQVFNVVGAFQLFFFTRGDRLIVAPTPTSSNTVALQYVSGWWIQADGESAPTGDAPTDVDDRVLLDSQMMVHRVRRDFLRAKGFDSEAASEDYERALERAKGSAEAAPVLNLNNSPFSRFRLLDNNNLPPTGYG